MRCHFVFDEEYKQNFLVPECWDVVISGDIEDCTCGFKYQIRDFDTPTIKELKKEINDLTEIIKEQQKCISHCGSN